MLIKVLHQEKG